MSINIVDICKYKYPGMIEAGLITFCQPLNGLKIQSWNVPNIPQPAESDLLAEASIYEPMKLNDDCQIQCEIRIQELLLSAAKSKTYESIYSITSYANSTNAQWAAEAKAFIAWRDNIYQIAIQMQTDVKNGTIPLPNVDDFIQSLPAITWP
jgi:hypothetical protein